MMYVTCIRIKLLLKNNTLFSLIFLKFFIWFLKRWTLLLCTKENDWIFHISEGIGSSFINIPTAILQKLVKLSGRRKSLTTGSFFPIFCPFWYRTKSHCSWGLMIIYTLRDLPWMRFLSQTSRIVLEKWTCMLLCFHCTSFI